MYARSFLFQLFHSRSKIYELIQVDIIIYALFKFLSNYNFGFLLVVLCCAVLYGHGTKVQFYHG